MAFPGSGWSRCDPPDLHPPRMRTAYRRRPTQPLPHPRPSAPATARSQAQSQRHTIPPLAQAQTPSPRARRSHLPPLRQPRKLRPHLRTPAPRPLPRNPRRLHVALPLMSWPDRRRTSSLCAVTATVANGPGGHPGRHYPVVPSDREISAASESPDAEAGHQRRRAD
jgi:hypothetical protein